MKRIITLAPMVFILQLVHTQKIVLTKDIELIRLSNNSYMHVSYTEFQGNRRLASNGVLFIEKDEAFLFDTPMNDSLTKDLVRYIEDSMKIRIIGFIPNHWHSDCMGGLGYLKSQGIKSWANEMTNDMAERNKLPVPDNGFKDSLILWSGNKEIYCYYLGGGHTPDNIVVWIPSENLLFPGCMVKDMNANNLGNIAEAEFTQWSKTLEKILSKFPYAEIVVPGHGNYGGKELIEHTLDLLSRNN